MTAWVVWALILFLQNASFTWVSRARNSPDIKMHALASVFSNGVFFAQLYCAVDQIRTAHGFWQISGVITFYTFWTVAGAVTMHWVMLHRSRAIRVWVLAIRSRRWTKQYERDGGTTYKR